LGRDLILAVPTQPALLEAYRESSDAERRVSVAASIWIAVLGGTCNLPGRLKAETPKRQEIERTGH